MARYTLEDLTTNKIVGINLPQFKKVQWAVCKQFGSPTGFWSTQASISMQIKIPITIMLNGKYEYKTTSRFFRICKEDLDESKLETYLNYKRLPINYVVGVDITKAHITEPISSMSNYHLKESLRTAWYDGSVQEMIETKAELLKRGEFRTKKRPANYNKPQKYTNRGTKVNKRATQRK